MGGSKGTVRPGPWMAFAPEHVGRGTPAISGGALFFQSDILPNNMA